MSSLFISHASADAGTAWELAARLKEWGYGSLFLDFDPDHGIQAGVDWEAELYARLKRARALVAVVSREFLESRWCFAEVAQARALGKPVFPVKIERCEPGSLLDDRQAVDLFRDEREGYDRLQRGLESLLGADLPFDLERPYPGLASFDSGDAGAFFGREDEQAAVIEALERMRRRSEPRLAVILGASGSGKSSLIKAGVLPRLARDRWLVVPPLRPGERPVLALARAFAAAFEETGASRGWRQVSNFLAAGATAGHPWLALAEDLREAAGERRATVLLTIDQLEEALVPSRKDEGERHAAFRSDLRAALEESDGTLLVIATLRSDFLGRFQLAPELRDLPFEDLPLGPMPRERLDRVIVGPAERVGVELEDGLVRRLVADTGRTDALPLLAFTLRELWESREGDTITEELYETRLGSIEGAVARIAEGIGASLGSEEERALRSAFFRMVRLDEEGRFVRCSARWKDIRGPARPRIERFVDEHLLVSDTVEGKRRIEVTHEAIFSAWKRLARWLDQERELLLFRQRLDRARAEWSRFGEDPSALLDGAALIEAERWAEERNEDLDERDHEFVRRSAERRDRRQAAVLRRRRAVIGGLAAGLALAVALASLAAWQWSQAEEQRRQAEARQLATVAAAHGTDSVEELVPRLLLATESLRSAWTPEGYAAWAPAAAGLLPGPTRRLAVTGEVAGLAVHPSEPWMAVADHAAGIRVLEISSGRPRAELDHPEGGHALTFSPDGRWLAAGWNERITVWRTDGWRLVKTIDGFGHTDDIAFSEDGEQLAAAQREVVLGPVSTRTWRLPEPTPREDGDYALAVAFATDGQGLAIGGTEALELWFHTEPESTWEQAARLHASLDVRVSPGDPRTEPRLKYRTERFVDRFHAALGEEGVSLESALSSSARELTLGMEVERIRPTIPSDRWWVVPQSDGALGFFESERGVPGYTVRVAPAGGIERFAFSADERWLVTGGRALEVWDLAETSRVEATRRIPGSRLRAVAFSPDGSWLAVCQEDEPRVRLFATTTWRETSALDRGCSELGFADDDQLLARHDRERAVHLLVRRDGAWRSGAVTPALPTGGEIALSPDGRWAAVRVPYSGLPRYRELVRPSRTGIVDLETGGEVAWRTHEETDIEDFLRDIERFHPGLTRERLVVRWEMETGDGAGDEIELGAEGRLDLIDRSADWPSISFERRPTSPDGRWRADDRSPATLVEPEGGREIVRLAEGEVAEAAFSPDRGHGSEWVALAAEHWLLLWRLNPVEALAEETCARVPRNLRPDEWPLDGPPPVTCPDL